mgnify:CR=1 FL=1
MGANYPYIETIVSIPYFLTLLVSDRVQTVTEDLSKFHMNIPDYQ